MMKKPFPLGEGFYLSASPSERASKAAFSSVENNVAMKKPTSLWLAYWSNFWAVGSSVVAFYFVCSYFAFLSGITKMNNKELSSSI